METNARPVISVKTIVNAPVKTVWKNWTTPESIIGWNYASDDWQTTRAKNDLREGGIFIYRMEAKDGSMGFDFEGVYNKVIPNREIEYTIGDGRKVMVIFSPSHDKTEVIEVFEAESTNPVELQHDGWQSILNNFKKYTEAAKE